MAEILYSTPAVILCLSMNSGRTFFGTPDAVHMFFLSSSSLHWFPSFARGEVFVCKKFL